jgi:hypothetical protein
MGARGLIVAVFVCVVGALACMSPPALALRQHIYSSSFGVKGSGGGQFEEPTGIAVAESTDEVYVVDRRQGRVEIFGSSGATVLGEFDGAGAPTGVFSSPETIAVDNSTNPLDPSAGDVYVADVGHDVVDKFTSSGTYLGQIGTGAEGRPLGRLDGVAVDPQGQVWVYQDGSAEIDDYSDGLGNQFLASRKSPFGTSPGFAVNSNDDLYVNRGAEVVAKLDSSGKELIGEIDREQTKGVAVNTGSGSVYVDNVSTVAAFDASGAPLGSFGAGHLGEGNGVAVNAATETVYVADLSADAVKVFTAVTIPTVTTGEASGLQTEGDATLNGLVDPEGVPVSSCEFEYGTSTSYGSMIACSPSPGAGSGGVPVSAHLSGLTPDTVYHFRLVAGNANGENQARDETFVAGSRPTIANEAIVDVGSIAASLRAEVNAGGAPATYSVEYGPTTAYGSSTSESSVGAPREAVGVAADLDGLQPGTLYHARFVVGNELGTVSGGDLTFTTSANVVASASELPDNRVYELVSSPSGNEDVYTPSGSATKEEDFDTERAVRVAANGDAVVYLGDPQSTGGSGDLGNGLGNQYLATRGRNGWSEINLQPFNETEWEGFTGDLSMGVARMPEPLTASSPAAPGECRTPPLYAYSTADQVYHPLVTTLPAQGPTLCGGEFAGSSADGSHLLFQQHSALTAGAIAGEEETEYNLYDSVGGRLYLVNVSPEGKPDPDARFGSPSLLFSSPNVRSDFGNAISSDGSHIYWTEVTSEDPAQIKRLLVRENDTQPQSPLDGRGECSIPVDACTVQVDAGQGGSSGGGGGRFWTASKDGSKAFFTDCAKLTADSTAVSSGECVREGGEGPVGNDLYEFDLDKPAGSRLTDLTVDGNAADTLGADVQGVIGVNETGEAGAYLYFVAEGVLAENQDAGHEKAESGKDNVYLRHGGVTTFVATLAPSDDEFDTVTSNGRKFYGDWRAEPGSRTAELTPDGRHLVFRSSQSLTGYDNRASGNAESVPEVYVYDADTSGLTCTSCDPTGAPPTEALEQGRLYRLGAVLPVSIHNTYMLRWISEDGSRVVFDTGQPLVPDDTNGHQDVYEWEREGSGSCTDRGGCVYLLSSGTSSDDTYLLDASASASDVFIVTRSQLVPQAHDENFAVYDVRIDGGFPEFSTACTGAGCQGVPPAPPVFATPSSATFNGVGNFEAPSQAGVTARSKTTKCKQGMVRKKSKCVKKRRAKKKAKHTKRSKKGRK